MSKYDKMIYLLLFFSFFIPGRVPRSAFIPYLMVFLIFFKLLVVDHVRFEMYIYLFFLPILLIPASYLVETIWWGHTGLGEVRSFLIYYLIWCTLNASVFTIFYKRSNLNSLLITYMFFGLLLSAIAIQQFFNIFDLNAMYLPQIIPPSTVHNISRVRALINGFGRPLGIVGNPNEVGFQLVLCFIASAYYFFNIKTNMLSITSFFFCFFAVILTSSRSSIAALVVAFLIIFLTSKIRFPRKMFLITSILTLLSLFLAFFSGTKPFDDIFHRIAGLAAIGEDESWQARKVLFWWFNMKWFKNSPILGVGTLSSIKLEASDNELLLLLRQLGLIGFFNLMIALLYPLIKCLCFKSAEKKYLSLPFALLVSGGLYMLPSAFISSPFLYYPWAILYFASVASGFDSGQDHSGSLLLNVDALQIRGNPSSKRPATR